MDHIKRHYYMSMTAINPTRIVPLGPELDFSAPHDRGALRAALVARFAGHRPPAHVAALTRFQAAMSRQQQHVVGRVDNAGKLAAAFVALQAVALEPAVVDMRVSASTERQLRAAASDKRRGTSPPQRSRLPAQRRVMIAVMAAFAAR